MKTLVFFSLALLLLYVLRILKFKRNWETYPEFKPAADHKGIAVSVIIAFRNEISNLGALLSSLKDQEYPVDLFEIILVNDGSDDGSDALVRHYCERNTNFIYRDNQEIPGKKSALRTGIDAASHDVIITTDADCTMDRRWLATIAIFWSEKNPDMMIGLVDMVKGTGHFKQFQEVEFLSLIASGAGAAAGNMPIYCNGACLGYRKSLYLQMDDPLREGIASGDDTFMLHNVKKSKDKRILLLKSVDATVTTHSLLNRKDFLNQRLRWISKGRHYSDIATLYTAFIVLMVNALLLASFALLCMNLKPWLFLTIYAGKTLTDYFFLRSYMSFFGKALPPIRFMAYSLIYPFYVVFLGTASFFFSYTWKGRQYKPAA